MTAEELQAEILRLCRLVDKGVAGHHENQVKAAEAEHAYRLAAATAYLNTTGTVAEREALVEMDTHELREAWLVAQALAKSALEALRARQSQLSATQTLAGAYREEARLGRTRPDV